MTNQESVTRAFVAFTEALIRQPAKLDARYAAFREACARLTPEEFATMTTAGRSSELLAGFMLACAKFAWVVRHALELLKQYRRDRA